MDTFYNHKAIQEKWQKIWEETKCFKATVDHSKEKYYVLDMFPYPSGAGLHVGHVTGYTATDIIARYKRQQGFNVLHPMGWDSFGLQAEQYAVRTGQHPAQTTLKNADTYRRQLKSLGFSYDWDREITTSEPEYYKWTQWIFTKLYEKGLAFEAEILVNYCPHLGTVLANEEIENGFSKEGTYPIERRPLRQWVLKITEYADRLLEDLEDLDWPDYLKRLQRNWIGKSVGAEVRFKIEGSSEHIEVFTTRHDTLFGVTFAVLSPEHPLVDELVTQEQKSAVDAYRKEVSAKSDLERTDLNKNKTGVFTGAYAINPVNNEKLPIWIADYVLMGYGTGAVMAVPAHDERDFEFATKFQLPIKSVFKTEDESCFTKGEGSLINSGFLNGLSIAEGKKAMATFLEDNGCGKQAISYKLRDWLFSRQRYWGEPIPILHFEDGTKRALELDELPLTLPDITDYKPSGDSNSPLNNARDWVEITDAKTGKKAVREINTMPQWAGSCWYYLRFCDPKNTEKAWSEEDEKYWMPVDLYVGGVEHAVLHLLYARFWHKVLFDLGYVSTKEPFQRLRNQGLVTAHSYKREGGEYLSPDDVEKSGKGYVEKTTNTPVVEQVEKMSKSKLNGVSPDEMLDEYGADALRLYEMFMAPFDKEKMWNTDAVSGCYRFLKRFYALVFSDKVTEDDSDEGLRLAHRLVHGVQKNIETMQFNTAIAKMMEFINQFAPLDKYPKKALLFAVQSLSSFAPHIAEECWQALGQKEGLSFAPFPKADPKYLTDDTVTFACQVNGKLRGTWKLPPDSDKESLLAQAKSDPNVAKYITGDIVKVIFVPKKLLNLVVKQ